MNKLKKRIDLILKRLKKAYPKARVSKRYKNPFKILVVTILSAQCRDERVEKIASGLFKRYKTIKDFAKSNQGALEKQIYSAGFYRNKARNIIVASRRILKEYHGRVPRNIGELIRLPGVGRKTANIVLSSSFNIAEGIAVDTHVKRISRRLRLTGEKDPYKIENELLKAVPRRWWLEFNYLIVNHGKKICKARRPLCCECVIRRLCPSSRCRQ